MLPLGLPKTFHRAQTEVLIPAYFVCRELRGMRLLSPVSAWHNYSLRLECSVPQMNAKSSLLIATYSGVIMLNKMCFEVNKNNTIILHIG